ncbi:hypothetical protein AWC38_SpisGene9865 [Stylophora pistillata]|uniref:Uncharacterized protein n=1 Tax=Stylophora pistillata TaxID=50429 RepID=A0A2B4S6H6_STYPI|nr:hypothetical protein AWC38_SpisGene9865 [Stylophora pistillata]
MMPKSRSRGKENFQFLKQFLEDSSASDLELDREKNIAETSTKRNGSSQSESVKKGKDSAFPVGTYPVLFKKTCRSKSCQTRLSSFPLFPLPEETVWISDEERETKKKPLISRKKKKQTRSAPRDANKDTIKQEDETQKLDSKVKNPDGTRKSFRSEHQLKETDNPVIKTWLHKKAIVARKQKKLERQEKRAKRAALQEEARIQAERAFESIERVGLWLRKKRKQAKLEWRKSHTRVTPQQGDGSLHSTSPAEDQNYSKKKVLLDMKSESSKEGNAANLVKQRAKTAMDHTKQMSLSHPKTATKRPKTAKERPTKNADTKAKATNAASSHDSLKKMQALSYDEWLKLKRNGDKEKMIKKKRDLIDSHLEAVIKELGKKRVEKIMSPRKHVDTGLKKFSCSPQQLPQSDNSKLNKANPYRWVLSRQPRPEPQGCDFPETHGADNATSASGKHSVESNNDTSGVEQHQICQEVNDTYDELKPSIEKVKGILDSEIKKLKESGKGLDKPIDSPVSSSTTPDESTTEELRLSQPMSARPFYARPTTAPPLTTKPGSTHLTKEQKKKIAADLDVLGICGSESSEKDEIEKDEIEIETVIDVEKDTKSTVRENYFDYGSDIDPPTIQPPEFVQ